jgi:hypothetical protein
MKGFSTSRLFKAAGKRVRASPVPTRCVIPDNSLRMNWSTCVGVGFAEKDECIFDIGE